MTREQRLVTLALLSLVIVVVLALAGRATATPPYSPTPISERMFADVPAPRPGPALPRRVPQDRTGASEHRAGASLLPSASGPEADADGGPTSLTGDAASVVGQPADRSTPRLAASRPTARPQQAGSPPAPVLPGRQRSGVATFYDNGPGLYAAAGPALRVPGWRGRSVAVSTIAGGVIRSVSVTLIDWCACGDRVGQPTLLDLSADAFRILADGDLTLGVLRVEVSGL